MRKLKVMAEQDCGLTALVPEARLEPPLQGGLYGNAWHLLENRCKEYREGQKKEGEGVSRSERKGHHRREHQRKSKTVPETPVPRGSRGRAIRTSGTTQPYPGQKLCILTAESLGFLELSSLSKRIFKG